jgi:mannose-6-phosphate isomerase-like protein (cupin superfamily)
LALLPGPRWFYSLGFRAEHRADVQGVGCVDQERPARTEHFEVLAGSLEMLVGGETRLLRSGEKAVAGENVLHRFRNPTDAPTRFLVELRPGHAGFEKAIKAGTGWRPTA